MPDSLEPPAPDWACAGPRLIQREQSIGVRVKEANSETPTANAEVRPNDDMTRPTIPFMNAMGRNTAIREQVGLGGLERRHDEDGLVGDDLELVALGQRGPDLVQASADGLGDLDGVLIGLLIDDDGDGGLAVEQGAGALLGGLHGDAGDL